MSRSKLHTSFTNLQSHSVIALYYCASGIMDNKNAKMQVDESENYLLIVTTNCRAIRIRAVVAVVLAQYHEEEQQ